MPITPTYPGVYIEELPSTSHVVIAAPTAIAVFVGYTNPFWLMQGGAAPPFGDAVAIQSFADYQLQFGGFFSWPLLPDYVGQAVNQFFTNGGSTAYVVALDASSAVDNGASPPASVTLDPATAALGTGGPPATGGFTFTALQPVGQPSGPTPGMLMTLTLSNVSDDTADLTISYGTTPPETHRRLTLATLADTVNAQSRLASVAELGTVPATFESWGSPVNFEYADAPTSDWEIITPSALQAVFADNAPLDKVDIFNLMALPGITDSATLAQALAYCERKRAFYIMDPPATAVADSLAESLLPAADGTADTIQDIITAGTVPLSPNGALYFPPLQTADPVTGLPSVSPPSGFVAGIFAREDSNRGVWKSPAGLETTILGTTGVVPWGVMTDVQQGVLNPLGVDCIRTFPGSGTVVFGARTLVAGNVAEQQWWYVAVRRMALFIEDSLYDSLKWAIFEPNDTPLWSALSSEVSAFMLGLYRQGAFQGATASQAFNVQSDSTTTSQADIDAGRVNILVGFAPLKPAEFVVIQIQQLAGQTQS